MMPRAAVPLLMSAALLAGCASQSETPPPVPPDALPAGTTLGTGAIVGRVVYTDAAPEPETISMHSDANCRRRQSGEAHKEDLLVEEDGSLRNVFVHVVSGIEQVFAPPESPTRLDQSGCVYRPHVLGIQVGQPLRIINSDPTLHNVHSLSRATQPFNFAMAVEGQESTRYFHAPEVMVKLKCDVHPWMSAWIGVVPHPFFEVTGEAGRFRLEGLPAGEVTVEAWHETLGSLRRNVTLGDDERREITIEYPG
jgi:plastocyanin